MQRLRLVQVFISQLSDLIIVLDEPLAGLSGTEKEIVMKNINYFTLLQMKLLNNGIGYFFVKMTPF